MSQMLIDAATRAFHAQFGCVPEAAAFAPGRVNLMGEHTDYNGGCVLPVTLDLGIGVAIGRCGVPGEVRLVSDGFAGQTVRSVGDRATGHWSDYAFGSLLAVARDTIAADGLRVAISNDVPAGAGLSSSAAIEVASIRAIAALLGQAVDPVATARTARAVENDFVGMPCGIMDQFAVSVGLPGAVLFLDTATLAYETVPLLPGHSFLVIHSGVAHKLAEDGYATRVAECKAACTAMKVGTLGSLDLDAMDRIAALPTPLDRRARHIVTENARVHAARSALRSADATALGVIMLESHASQRDDYAVSVPEVDAVVDTVMTMGGIGARLTGGGFGGSILALIRSEKIDSFTDSLEQLQPRARLLASISALV